MELAAPGRQLQSAGSGFREQMTSAGDSVRDVPLVGDQIAAPFRQVSGAGTTIEQAGTDLVDAVTRLANILGWVTALVPIIIVGLVWLVLRGRFVRRASAAQRFIDNAADLDLFALRAMAGQPMRKLAAISRRPDRRVASRRRGDDPVAGPARAARHRPAPARVSRGDAPDLTVLGQAAGGLGVRAGRRART